MQRSGTVVKATNVIRHFATPTDSSRTLRQGNYVRAASGLGLTDATSAAQQRLFRRGHAAPDPDGAKPIEEFKVGDLVLSAPEDNSDGTGRRAPGGKGCSNASRGS